MNKDLSDSQQIEFIIERLDSCRINLRNYNNKLKEAETKEEKFKLRGRIARIKAGENRWREILGTISKEKESFNNPKRRKIQ